MLVYGDVVREADPAAEWEAVGSDWAGALAMPAGLPRHAALVQAFIAAAELAQGLADAESEASGLDQPGPATELVMEQLRAMADVVLASWRSGFDRSGVSAAPWPLLPGSGFPAQVRCKRGEGYAYYALYPEAFGMAAEPLAGERDIRVVGLRSIGTGLAAMAAAGAGAGAPTTLRPKGHPFGRTIDPGPAVRRALLDGEPSAFAIVDEGPGLSGSSFAGAARWLEQNGVARSRIHLLPSHAGEPGVEAPEDRRRWWRTATRHCVTFDALIRNTPRREHRLASWVETIVGPLEGPLDDISGGRWREGRSEAEWPAVNAWQERLKFRAHAGEQTWLVKFSGVDALGAAVLRRARALADAGFTPEPAGFAHGFLVERWRDDASPLDTEHAHTAGFHARLADYLGFRARAFGTGLRGASLPELAHMLAVNAAEALGPAADGATESYRADAAALQRYAIPVVTDNRLHRHEWIVTRAGEVLKTDALDHAFSHDLVGPQDSAWDVAGAMIEFDLDPDAAERLRRVVSAAAGRDVSPALVRFFLPCYAAFQLGWWTMAANAHGGWPEEQVRLRHEAARYERLLRGLLGL